MWRRQHWQPHSELVLSSERKNTCTYIYIYILNMNSLMMAKWRPNISTMFWSGVFIQIIRVSYTVIPHLLKLVWANFEGSSKNRKYMKIHYIPIYLSSPLNFQSFVQIPGKFWANIGQGCNSTKKSWSTYPPPPLNVPLSDIRECI